MSQMVWGVIGVGVALITLLIGVLIYLFFQGNNLSASRLNKIGNVSGGNRANKVRVEPVLPKIFPVIGIMVFLVIVARAVAVAGYWQWCAIREADLLRTQGVVVQGVITEKHVHVGAKGARTYYISYAFIPREIPSSEISDFLSVSPWFYSSVEQGNPLDILYVHSDPWIHRVQMFYTLGDFSPSGGIICSVVVLVALFFIWILIREYDRSARLDREGVEGSAWVTDLSTETDAKGQTTCYVVYEIAQSFTVRHTISKDMYGRLKVGMSVPVRYVPNDPRIFRPNWGNL